MAVARVAVMKFFWLAFFAALRIENVNGSYLDRPRLHFSGSFQADVSTINNYDTNFIVPQPDLIKEWNPIGTGEFRLYNMTVTSVTYLDGTDSKSDPIVGLPMLNADTFTAGKLVDLDVDVQLYKGEIWGQHIGLNWAKPNERQHNSFYGHLTPTNLGHDVWRRAICSPDTTTHNFSSVAKSLLTNVTWAEHIDSRLLQELKNRTEYTEDGSSAYLSIRLLMYFMVRDYSPTNYTFGRIHGTIGPAFLDEPIQFNGQRKLHIGHTKQPSPDFFPKIPQCKGQNVTAWVYNVPFRRIQVGPKDEIIRISADFGNAVVMDQYQNPLDLGDLVLGIKTKFNNSDHTCVERLGYLNYRTRNWLNESAGIQEFPPDPKTSLTKHQLDILGNSPVVIMSVMHDHDAQFSAGTGHQEIQAKDEGLTVLPFCPSEHPLLGEPTHGALMLQEKPIYARPWKKFIFRANPNETHPFHVLVTKYGQPMSNATVNLFPTLVADDWNATFNAHPVDGVTYAKNVKTDSNGIASFILHAHNVGEPRHVYNIDGQVYRYSYNVSNLNIEEESLVAPDASMAPTDQTPLTYINDVAILVFSNVSYPEKDSITWVDHVSPIFKQYAQLYPVMKPIVNMANYTDVKLRKRPLVYALSLPMSHPSHMPVTRDLSKAKREMILQWFDNGCRYNSTHMDGPHPEPCQCTTFWNQTMMPESCGKGLQPKEYPYSAIYSRFAQLGSIRTRQTDLQFNSESVNAPCDRYNADWQGMALHDKPSLANLHCLLQTAIRLEFSTLPPYLTALYSIIDGCNVEVQRLLHSICMQEMLHMAQASNLLIALGGHPIMNTKQFAPTYPGNLPGGVLPGLKVHLRKVSLYQILYNFMAIEYPSKTNVDLDHPEFHNNTIGAFYKYVNETLNDLYAQKGEAIFCQECFKNEVKWLDAPGTLYNVTDITTAHKAIDEIVEQGEGSGPFDPKSGEELAHYYKFEEIVCGNYLIQNSTGGYQFNGPLIPLDERGVYPMADDPSTSNLAPNTNASHYSRVFNEGYRHLLNRLHDVFNGKPDGFGDAVSLMQSLKIHAKLLMRTFPDIEDNYYTVGPAWEYDAV